MAGTACGRNQGKGASEMIPFNKASISELEKDYLLDALQNSKLSGDGKYTMRVYEQLRERLGLENVLLCSSGW